MESDENQKKKKKGAQVLVRLSPEEQAHIEKLEGSFGGSVQKIFRKVIMGLSIPTVVLHPETARALLSQVNRIGNNINQISKHMNQGSSRGWYTEFEEAAAELKAIGELLRRHLGHC